MEYPESPYSEVVSPTSFMYKVYGWMSLALAMTAGMAYYVFKNPSMYASIKTNPWFLIGIIILQFVLVIVLSGFILKMSFTTAFITFLVYAVLMGVTMSFIFEIYTTASIYATFLATSGMFGITCLYGYFTKSDLTSVGSFAFMGLIGLILGGLVNFFLKSSTFSFILSAAGVLIFVLLTAYDSQKIKQMANRLIASPETRSKIAILGALTLYLDFINLFLYMLQFMGQRKEN